MDRKTAMKCPEELEALKVSVFCCLLDTELSFLWTTPYFLSSMGYTKIEFRGLYQSLRQLCAQFPEDYSAVREALSQAQNDGAADIEVTIRLPMRTSGFSWFCLKGTIGENPAAGGPVLKASLTDMNAAVEKEEQARLYQQAAQYFRLMMDAYGGNIYISDIETYELLYLNGNSCTTVGYPLEQLLGRKCYEVIQGRSEPCPFCTNDKLREDEYYEWEFNNPFLKRAYLLKDRLINWQGRRARLEMSHDMYTNEFKLVKKSREQEALLRSVPGGFARLDARDCVTVLWYGADFLEMIGYTAEQFKNELHSRWTFIQPEDLQRVIPILRELMVTGGDAVTEARITTRGGERKIFTITFSYAKGEESWDGIPSFYTIGLDVTRERREQEQQRLMLEDAYKTAQIASEAKTNFLSSMSHDIRTPMNAIMGMAAIAEANLDSPEKIRDCLSKINISAHHLLGLINEVLDMSKIESGKIDLTSETVSLPELLQNIINMCQPLLAEKKQKFQISADHVRHERVITDGGRLQQVLMNLLTNAVKYTPDGGSIFLRVRELPEDIGSRGQFEFVIEDNGIGMAAEYLPHIFEPFTRAEDTRINKIQGTGLGLAITQNIVHMMNGTIEVKSELGKGSQFIAAIPLELCGEDEGSGIELAGLSVLIVDDDEAVCRSAAALLHEMKIKGQWAASSGAAVQRIAEARRRGERFFAVMLGWKMSGEDGTVPIREIRKEAGIDVPIILLTAWDSPQAEGQLAALGADAFIKKPLFKSKMASALRRFYKNESAGAAESSAEAPSAAMPAQKILLVEDNDLNREIASELLRMNGFIIDEAENGQLAVEKFAASAPDEYGCILMDIQMPVMDGYAATRAIRLLTRRDAQTVPILALTANAFATDLAKAHSAGMNDHIAKPIEVDRLLEALRRWVM